MPPEDATVPSLDLTGSEAEELHSALLAAFDASTLDQFLSFRMNVTFGAVVGTGNFAKQVFELIRWVQQEGRDGELVKKVRAFSTNPRLQQVADRLLDPARRVPPVNRVAPPARPPAPVDPAVLRRAITAAFLREDLAVLCADVEEKLRAHNITNVPVNLEIFPGGGKEILVLNLIQYLNVRGYLSVLVEAVREARPNIGL